tara:strand:+ start:3325 stop:5997 length:2673 start_codon:yes stop_codon:yes gene_type:complete
MHFCNICIFNHNNITNINPLKSLLRFTENQNIEIKQIYSVSKQKIEENCLIELQKFANTNNIKLINLELKSDILTDLSSVYENDLPLFYIESTSDSKFLCGVQEWNKFNEPIYIKEVYDKYSYNKLFYLPYYLIKNETYPNIISLTPVEKKCLLHDFKIKNDCDKNCMHDYLDKITDNVIIELFKNILKCNYSDIICNEIQLLIDEGRSKYQKWLIYYFFGIASYYTENYKKSKEYFKNCTLLVNKKEPIYFIAKIYFSNEDYKNCLKMLENKNMKTIDNMFINNEICDFHIKYLELLCQFKSNNLVNSLEIARDIIDSKSCPKQYRRILLFYMNKLLQNVSDEIKNVPDIVKNSKYTEFVYSSGIHYKVLTRNESIIDVKKEEKKISIEIDKDTSWNFEIDTFEEFSCFNHKNNNLLLVSSLCPLKINNIKDSKIIKLLEYETESYLKNYTFISKFINYNNIYLALVTFKNNFVSCKDKLYRLICLDSNNLMPIFVSPIIKINIDKNSIKDIFVSNDNLIILGVKYNAYIPVSKLYLEENIPIDYNPNIYIERNDNMSLSIKCCNYDIPIKKYKNYNLDNDDAKDKVIIDLNQNIITNTKTLFSQLITDFIYLPENIETKTKEHEIAFYSNTTDIELENYLKEKDISICKDYSLAKYLIITTFDMENLSYKQVSNIITSKTLIITLLEEEEVNNITGIIYKNNPYLNKLFLFNIVKNDDYKEFIIDKIILDNQYDIREEYFDIDINNIYNNTNLYEYTLKFLEYEKQLDKKINIANTDKDYKIELMTKLHRKTENIVLIDVLKFILYNNQEITVLTDKDDIPELIYKLNILGDFYNLTEIESEKFIGSTSLIILENSSNIENWRHLYNKDCLIYLTTENKIIYLSDTNS